MIDAKELYLIDNDKFNFLGWLIGQCLNGSKKKVAPTIRSLPQEETAHELEDFTRFVPLLLLSFLERL